MNTARKQVFENPSVLIVEQEESMRDFLVLSLRAEGVSVQAINTLEEAYDRVAHTEFSLVLLADPRCRDTVLKTSTARGSDSGFLARKPREEMSQHSGFASNFFQEDETQECHKHTQTQSAYTACGGLDP